MPLVDKEYTEEDLFYLKEIFKSVNDIKEMLPDVSVQYRAILDELALAGWYMDYELPLLTVATLILSDYQNKTHLDNYLNNSSCDLKSSLFGS